MYLHWILTNMQTRVVWYISRALSERSLQWPSPPSQTRGKHCFNFLLYKCLSTPEFHGSGITWPWNAVLCGLLTFLSILPAEAQTFFAANLFQGCLHSGRLWNANPLGTKSRYVYCPPQKFQADRLSDPLTACAGAAGPMSGHLMGTVLGKQPKKCWSFGHC